METPNPVPWARQARKDIGVRSGIKGLQGDRKGSIKIAR
jgi:hypothetical protein